MRLGSLCCALACALACGWPRPACADGVGVVAATTAGSGRAAIEAAMAAAIGEGRPPRVVEDAVARARAAVAAGAVPIETLRRFRRVRELIDEGWHAYLRVSFDLARSRLAEARTEAESLVALPGGAVLYADAALRLGIVLARLGRTARSRAVLALARALDPDRPITLAEFSPDVVATVRAARAATPPTRSVEIASEPPGAVATVDGTRLGRTPLRAQLALGQHLVVLRARYFQPRALAFAVDPGTAEIHLALDRDRAWTRLAEGPAIGTATSGAQELVDATIGYADLDAVALAVATGRRGAEALLVQRCAGVPARCTAVVEIGYEPGGLLAAARAAWKAVHAADLRYPPSVLSDPRVVAPPRVAHHCELCRSPWLWGGVGAAAVIATIVTIELANTSRPPPIVGIDPGQYTTP